MRVNKVSFGVELVPREPLWRTCIMANLCDKLGFDNIWVSDHFFNRNVFITLSTLTSYTKRIKLGPAIVNPYLYHPVTIAQSIATLHEASKGRSTLGIGAGDKTSLNRLCIEREKPVKTVREAVVMIRRLLEGDAAQIEDRRCSNSIRLDFRRNYKIPIYVGAQGPLMIKMAKELADGVLINWSNITKLRECASLIADTRDYFTRGAHLIVSIHDDVDKARKTAIPFAAYIMAGTDEKVLNSFKISEEERSIVQHLLVAANWQKLYAVSRDEWIKTFSFYGTKKDLEELVRSLVDMGYSHIVFGGPLGPRVYSALKDMAKIVKNVKREIEE